MKKIRRYWNDQPLFWKTFVLLMFLAASVVLIGEGAGYLAENVADLAGRSLSGRVREVLFWFAAILASSLLGSLIISRIITGSLTRIQPVVERLSNGDLDSRIPHAETSRGDEIGRLSRGFNQMADNLSRLLESERTLIRDISHEMRSPLTRLKVALVLLAQDLGPAEPAATRLKQLEKDIDRLELMASQTLERARLETIEQSGFEKTELDLVSLVRASLEEQAPSAANDQKFIRFDGPASAPYFGNAVLLYRAAANLIKNALRHTAAGSTVLVQLRSSAGVIIFEVIDQGPGVPDEHLEDIFRPFYQVDSARAGNSGGFGLGLALARQAAQLHGGQIKAVNASASGATRGLKVSLTLPVALAGCGRSR